MTSHTCRSWTSTTPAWATSARPIALRVEALGRRLEEDPSGGPHERVPERIISAAISSEAIGSARSKPVIRITPAASAVPRNP